ncbi:MAG: hypothetical protein WEA34_00405 [Gemmatimonadota bacterium]
MKASSVLVALGLTAVAIVTIPVVARAQQPVPEGAQQPPPAEETELVFEREVFQYPSFTRPNPFVALDDDSAGPRFEQLSVIGIMHSQNPSASVAVLSTGGVSVAQDGTVSPVEGDAYYLRVGQRLGNVTIVEIHPERVVVDVEEFGLLDRRTLVFNSRREGGT